MLKTKFLIIFTLLVSLFVLQGCGNDPIQKDLLNYLNTELPNVAAKEEKAGEAFDSVTGNNYSDDLALYDVLEAEVIPTYSDFVNDLEQIKPATPEVQKIHEQFISSANMQLSGFIMIMSAIEKQDSAEFATANEKLSSARQMSREWETALKQLADAHGVKINPPN